eukprot:2762788-Amphidinium_carterae.1
MAAQLWRNVSWLVRRHLQSFSLVDMCQSLAQVKLQIELHLIVESVRSIAKAKVLLELHMEQSEEERALGPIRHCRDTLLHPLIHSVITSTL